MPKVRAFRERLGISQARLATLLNVAESSVRRWESGVSAPHPSHRRELAARLGVKERELELPPYRGDEDKPVRPMEPGLLSVSAEELEGVRADLAAALQRLDRALKAKRRRS